MPRSDGIDGGLRLRQSPHDTSSTTESSMKHGQMSPTNLPTTPDRNMSHTGTPDPAHSSSSNKHSKRESYKAQKRTYRSQKKEAAKELLSTITDPAVVLLGDWLKVRGTLKSWSKLWCVLKPGVLVLYKSDKHKGSQWVGTILLNTCQLLERPSKKDGFCFKLFHPLDQSIWATKGPKGETIGAFVQPLPYSYCIFRAPSEAAGKCWMDALELALKCTNLLKRSMTRLDNTADTSCHDLDHSDRSRHHAEDVPWQRSSQCEEDAVAGGSQNGGGEGESHLHDGDNDHTFSHSFTSIRAQERSMNDSDLERHFANQGKHMEQDVSTRQHTTARGADQVKTERLQHEISPTRDAEAEEVEELVFPGRDWTLLRPLAGPIREIGMFLPPAEVEVVFAWPQVVVDRPGHVTMGPGSLSDGAEVVPPPVLGAESIAVLASCKGAGISHFTGGRLLEGPGVHSEAVVFTDTLWGGYQPLTCRVITHIEDALVAQEQATLLLNRSVAQSESHVCMTATQVMPPVEGDVCVRDIVSSCSTECFTPDLDFSSYHVGEDSSLDHCQKSSERTGRKKEDGCRGGQNREAGVDAQSGKGPNLVFSVSEAKGMQDVKTQKSIRWESQLKNALAWEEGLRKKSKAKAWVSEEKPGRQAGSATACTGCDRQELNRVKDLCRQLLGAELSTDCFNWSNKISQCKSKANVRREESGQCVDLSSEDELTNKTKKMNSTEEKDVWDREKPNQGHSTIENSHNDDIQMKDKPTFYGDPLMCGEKSCLKSEQTREMKQPASVHTKVNRAGFVETDTPNQSQCWRGAHSGTKSLGLSQSKASVLCSAASFEGHLCGQGEYSHHAAKLMKCTALDHPDLSWPCPLCITRLFNNIVAEGFTETHLEKTAKDQLCGTQLCECYQKNISGVDVIKGLCRHSLENYAPSSNSVMQSSARANITREEGLSPEFSAGQGQCCEDKCMEGKQTKEPVTNLCSCVFGGVETGIVGDRCHTDPEGYLADDHHILGGVETGIVGDWYHAVPRGYHADHHQTCQQCQTIVSRLGQATTTDPVPPAAALPLCSHCPSAWSPQEDMGPSAGELCEALLMLRIRKLQALRWIQELEQKDVAMKTLLRSRKTGCVGRGQLLGEKVLLTGRDRGSMHGGRKPKQWNSHDSELMAHVTECMSHMAEQMNHTEVQIKEMIRTGEHVKQTNCSGEQTNHSTDQTDQSKQMNCLVNSMRQCAVQTSCVVEQTIHAAEQMSLSEQASHLRKQLNVSSEQMKDAGKQTNHWGEQLEQTDAKQRTDAKPMNSSREQTQSLSLRTDESRSGTDESQDNNRHGLCCTKLKRNRQC